MATQDGETTGFDLADHVEVLIGHTSPAIADVVLANNQMPARPDEDISAKTVRLRWPPSSTPPPRLILDDVLDADDPHHHDPVRLADAVIRALEQESGIRRRASSRSA